jgi:hypothetical protein
MRAVLDESRIESHRVLADAEVIRAGQATPRTRAATVYEIDPLEDHRWAQFLDRHPSASVYHSRAWLEALKRTYGCTPLVYTTTPPGFKLRNGLVFCRVESWLTGNRMVSLPFSDHCDPLGDPLEEGEDLKGLMGTLLGRFRQEGLKYTELRPRKPLAKFPGWVVPAKHYCFHSLDLSAGLEDLRSAMHKDCIQRKIKRAEREGMVYREGRSPEILGDFYRLFTQTRRKHGLPPQPFKWFLNLAETLGPAMQVRVALHSGRPVASIITLTHRNAMTYKYGCSDPEFAKLGGTPWLFWRLIREAKNWGLPELDLGRSDWENPGLIAFKDRLGARRTPVTYWRFPEPQGVADSLTNGRWQWLAGKFLAHAPAFLLAASGSLLYRHMG